MGCMQVARQAARIKGIRPAVRSNYCIKCLQASATTADISNRYIRLDTGDALMHLTAMCYTFARQYKLDQMQK